MGRFGDFFIDTMGQPIGRENAIPAGLLSKWWLSNYTYFGIERFKTLKTFQKFSNKMEICTNMLFMF
jgi:hypothetical protein